MLKFFCSFLFFFYAIASPSIAGNITFTEDGFVIAKVVKLGRKSVNHACRHDKRCYR